MPINTTCEKCPNIKGSHYCSFYNKKVWKGDEMCEDGYRARIAKGIDKCVEIEAKYGDIATDRLQGISDQVDAIEEEWHKKFYDPKKLEEFVFPERTQQILRGEIKIEEATPF